MYQYMCMYMIVKTFISKIRFNETAWENWITKRICNHCTVLVRSLLLLALETFKSRRWPAVANAGWRWQVCCSRASACLARRVLAVVSGHPSGNEWHQLGYNVNVLVEAHVLTWCHRHWRRRWGASWFDACGILSEHRVHREVHALVQVYRFGDRGLLCRKEWSFLVRLSGSRVVMV
jgi:hypothetical protein